MPLEEPRYGHVRHATVAIARPEAIEPVIQQARARVGRVVAGRV